MINLSLSRFKPSTWSVLRKPPHPALHEEEEESQWMLSDSNTNVNSMINRRVSLFYRYPLKAFHHMVCPCTLDGVCVVCPGTSELVGQQWIQTLFKHLSGSLQLTVSEGVSRNSQGKYCKFNLCTVK